MVFLLNQRVESLARLPDNAGFLEKGCRPIHVIIAEIGVVRGGYQDKTDVFPYSRFGVCMARYSEQEGDGLVCHHVFLIKYWLDKAMERMSLHY